MNLTMYQIDAFAENVFEGNPAAVVPLDDWLPDSKMQLIAQENNLSETAFFVKDDSRFHLRWFTPVSEVKICGHATLASAYVLFNELGYSEERIDFKTLSGVLSVSRDEDILTLALPNLNPAACETPDVLKNAFSSQPVECLKSEDYVVVFRKEDALQNIKVDFDQLKKLDLRGVAITSESDEYDFIVRFFAPKFGIPEDPVTGSAFCQLAPYWATKLNKTSFHSKQVSPRGGWVICELAGNSVRLSGKAVKYMSATIRINT